MTDPFGSIYASDYDNADQLLHTPRTSEHEAIPLTTRECVELFQEKVDEAKQHLQQSLAGSGVAGDAMRSKLTVDLSRKRLATIPSEVVAIIKPEVERFVSCNCFVSFRSIPDSESKTPAGP